MTQADDDLRPVNPDEIAEAMGWCLAGRGFPPRQVDGSAQGQVANIYLDDPDGPDQPIVLQVGRFESPEESRLPTIVSNAGWRTGNPPLHVSYRRTGAVLRPMLELRENPALWREDRDPVFQAARACFEEALAAL